MKQESCRGMKAEGLSDKLRGGVALLIAAIREIFDESAYARFLNRNRLLSSPSAYAAFRRENELAKARRPRCC